MVRRRLVLLALTTLLLLATTASARQPVQSPHYLLSSAPALEVGVVIDGALTPDSGRNFKDGTYLDVLVLRARAGEGIALLVESDAFDTFVSVFDPVGTLIAANDDAWDVSDAWYASKVTFEAALTGTYLVVVSGYAPTDLGAYRATRSAWQPPEPILVEIAAPGTFRGVLEPQAPVDYRFTVETPTTLTATLRSLDFDTYLTLLVDGVVVAENDDFEGTDAQLVLDLEPGTYVLEVAGFFDDAAGAYQLELDW